jgi:glycosyltransferase involved in cell wall biosynthesis
MASPFIRTALRRADVIVPNSRHLCRLLLEFEPELGLKTVLIPNGVAPDTIAPQTSSSDSDEARLITVSQLIRRKRVELVLQALNQLRQREIPARLTIVGEGPQKTKLQRIAASLKIDDVVDFAGYQFRDRVPHMLRKHDIFVLASQSEGMSNAVLEAMAAGLPIVTTRNGTHDIVLDAGCGLVVPAGGLDELTESLDHLARDPVTRQVYGQAALEYAHRNCWTDCAQQFEAVFSRLLYAGELAAVLS